MPRQWGREMGARLKAVSSGEGTPASVSGRTESVVFMEDDEPREWVAQVEPGVLISLVSLPEGGNDLKRIRFRYSSKPVWFWYFAIYFLFSYPNMKVVICFVVIMIIDICWGIQYCLDSIAFRYFNVNSGQLMLIGMWSHIARHYPRNYGSGPKSGSEISVRLGHFLNEITPPGIES